MTNANRRYGVEVIPLRSGGRTFICGAWILVREYPNGRVRVIGKDAPEETMEEAFNLLNRLRKAEGTI